MKDIDWFWVTNAASPEPVTNRETADLCGTVK